MLKQKIKMNKPGMLTNSKWLIALALLCVSQWALADISCSTGGACTQTIRLDPGWNAIYIKLKPDTQASEELFSDFVDGSGPQINSVWTWLAHRARVDFIQDPATEDLLSKPGWLRYFPESSDASVLTNLFSLSANRAYLVNLEGSESADLVIHGRPVLPRNRWIPNALNMTGFHIDGTSPPTFSDFFAASKAHVGSVIYQLDSLSGQWQLVDPQTTLMQPDAAYWIFSKGGSNYSGPLQLAQHTALDYGASFSALDLSLRNYSDQAHTININMLANGEPIYYENPDPAAQTRWLAMPASAEVSGDSQWRMSIGVRRVEFTQINYTETIEIVVPGYTRWLLSVTASAPNRIISANRADSKWALLLGKLAGWLVSPASAQTSYTGLWVGKVEINEVSQANNYRYDCIPDPALELTIPDPDELFRPVYIGIDPGTGMDLCTDENGVPIPLDPEELNSVASPYQFRVLLHQDENGQVRLLKDVIRMYQKEVGSPGEANYKAAAYVLLTDDSLISSYDGYKPRDGELIGSRTSSISYDFEGDTLNMGGEIGGVISQLMVLPAALPSNPFRHKYHNDHKQGYEITRHVELTFDTEAGTDLQSGYSLLTGSYNERINGLHKNPVFAAGLFSLQRVSDIGVLTSSVN